MISLKGFCLNQFGEKFYLKNENAYYHFCRLGFEEILFCMVLCKDPTNIETKVEEKENDSASEAINTINICCDENIH